MTTIIAFACGVLFGRWGEREWQKRVTAPRQPPADVFDAMNLPAVNFPTTWEK